jgi:hypothetical protein
VDLLDMNERVRSAALPLLVIALGPGDAGAAGPRTWKADGVTFELTASDFKAWTGERTGSPAVSIAALLAAEKKKFDGYAQDLAKELAGPDPPRWGESTMTESTTFEVLSVVGTLVAIRESSGSYTPGAAHPTRYDVLHVRDLARKDGSPSLLDYFSDKQLVHALKADPWIRRFANPEGGFAGAATLSDLVDALDVQYAQEQGEEGDCTFDVSFSTELVHQFFFHHVARDKVAVRIAIGPGSEWCNRLGGGQQVGLLLPIPERLREHLLKADRGEAGFLAGNRKGVGSTSFSADWELDVRTLVPRAR